jgi:hypothetical protein
VTALVDRYIALQEEQFLERVRAGGTLPDEREDELIDMFDELWRDMDDEEHNAVEAFLAIEITPSADVFFDVEDHDNVPRQRAA